MFSHQQGSSLSVNLAVKKINIHVDLVATNHSDCLPALCMFVCAEGGSESTGCSLNIVSFSDLKKKILRTLFSLGVSACTLTMQVEHQRCSRIGRVQKNHKI